MSYLHNCFGLCNNLFVCCWYLLEQDLNDEELAAFVNGEPADSDSDSAMDDHFVEDILKAPSLRDARQHLKSLAVFLTDNPHLSAQDEMQLHLLATKVSTMTVSRINQPAAFFSANR